MTQISPDAAARRDQARDETGRFGPSAAAEPDPADVDLGGAPGPPDFDVVADRHDETFHDDFAAADSAAREVAGAGFHGVVHVERHYDQDDVHDGQIGEVDETFEVRAFETREDLQDWADRAGMAPTEGATDDQFSSVDPYQHPHTGDVEEHDAFVRSPSA